jgi:two-component system LytT family response regulator
MPAVVFLTAYDQFAIHAFEAQALDYLVKPVTVVRFAATMKRLMRQLRAPTPANPGESIVVTTSRGATVLRVPEIDWIESADNYSRLWCGSRSYLLREPLHVLEERVREHGFLRVHRRAVVRLGGVRELRWSSGGGLVTVLDCGATIRISRRRRTAFVAAVRRLGRVPSATA